MEERKKKSVSHQNNPFLGASGGHEKEDKQDDVLVEPTKPGQTEAGQQAPPLSWSSKGTGGESQDMETRTFAISIRNRTEFTGNLFSRESVNVPGSE